MQPAHQPLVLTPQNIVPPTKSVPPTPMQGAILARGLLFQLWGQPINREHADLDGALVGGFAPRIKAREEINDDYYYDEAGQHPLIRALV